MLSRVYGRSWPRHWVKLATASLAVRPSMLSCCDWCHEYSTIPDINDLRKVFRQIRHNHQSASTRLAVMTLGVNGVKFLMNVFVNGCCLDVLIMTLLKFQFGMLWKLRLALLWNYLSISSLSCKIVYSIGSVLVILWH